MNELDKILDGLIQRTSDGKLIWSRAAADDQFATSIDAISVVVGKSSRFQGVIPGFPRLEIYNERGDLAEVIQVGDTTAVEQRQKIDRLRELARRSALDTQLTLEKLAKALEA